MLLVGVMFTYFLTVDQYQHPKPEEDCSQPYDYPMCERATTPDAQDDPSLLALYGGMVFVAIVGVILYVVSYAASVTKQKDITAFNSKQPSKEPLPELKAAPQSSGESAAEAQQAYPVGKTPTTIPNNTILPSDIAPPSAQPKTGVKEVPK